MNLSFRWLEELLDLASAALSDNHHTSLEDLGESQLRLRYRRLETVLNGRRRLIYQQRRNDLHRVVARFSDVSHISVTSISQEDRPPYFTVRLHTGPLRSVGVGFESSDADASVLGARLATILGVSVHSSPGAPRTAFF